ncbi:hypothetical protein B0H16DRAFT_1536889 [Mycena metata]|uniref:F-box domain-containing protein n=1 Tax=Mycena metata TaxID=1033252 RepID=A0AAD7NDJ7_9AGAR|nr:hypothetical protein B0H16DRAFT_1536889 [Mycena metata]
MSLDHRILPVELWLEVFAHLEERSYGYSYTPFQPLPGSASQWEVKSAYTSVVLVCRNWHAWAIGLLWRNFKFPDTASAQADSDDLLMDIQRKYGKWVLRVILPYSSTVTETFKPILPTQMLELYPNLQILIRPPHRQSPFQTLKYDFETTCPPLFSLKRLVWWHYTDASRTGGINALLDVLSAAPNLEYLFIGVEHSQPAYLPHPPLLHIRLASLRTLRLSAVHHWVRVLEDNPQTFGSQLTVVELGENIHFNSALSCLQPLQTCPSLRELDYHIFSTPLPETGPDVVYPSLTSIGFHVGDYSPAEWEHWEWEFLEKHFNVFMGPMFPNLRRFRIFEMPDKLPDLFFRLQERLTARGFVLEVGGHSYTSN